MEELVIGICTGICAGFVLGVACVKVWPGKLTADYVAAKNETDKVIKFVDTKVDAGLAGVHAKLDAALKVLHL